jgi:hypothetical protein
MGEPENDFFNVGRVNNRILPLNLFCYIFPLEISQSLAIRRNLEEVRKKEVSFWEIFCYSRTL